MSSCLLIIMAIYGSNDPPGTVPEGMVWIPGGTFQVGSESEHARPEENPVHRARVHGFFMDRHEVTNAQFAKFVEDTNYVTVAERSINWAELAEQLPPGTPEPAPELLQPGGLVFTPPGEEVGLGDYTRWWIWSPGASWRHPEGPGSTLEGRDDHPVVMVAWEDARAYADWAGKRLPTETEWERAARGGLEGAVYGWGSEDPTEGPARANIWQGEFPNKNTGDDGFLRTAPVGSYSPNGYGLHDMAGNVWEWCSDWYRPDAYCGREMELQIDPTGPRASLDPAEPGVPKRVTRGGSFLCHESYCLRYRPSARIGTAVDSGMSHLGFRCVQDVVPVEAAETDED